MGTYAVSWSGGKDCSFACWQAMSQGLKVSHLLNFTYTGSARSISHGLDAKMIALQAKAMGIPIVQPESSWETASASYHTVLTNLKKQGVIGLITGDLYLQEHRDWVEKVCLEAGIEALLPLWKMDTTRLLNDFIDAGFKAIVVSVKSDALGKEWLGRELDRTFAAEICRLPKIDPCGEGGEYHSFVYNGPTFQKPVEVVKGGEPVFREKHWFLDIKEYRLG